MRSFHGELEQRLECRARQRDSHVDGEWIQRWAEMRRSVSDRTSNTLASPCIRGRQLPIAVASGVNPPSVGATMRTIINGRKHHDQSSEWDPSHWADAESRLRH